MTKILYVEDNEDNVYMLSRRLKRKGFDIVIAVDGEQGVEMASSEKPDLILMDLSLPKMDGWTATKHIKGNIELKSIPIIALSAHAMEEHKQRALDSGCNDYDTKPVDLDRLLTKISKQLGNNND
ncbi:MAG: response regulator [Proteobacteria bacterium]|nr:response regulator [Pseudomonadota bacterium]